MSASLDFVIFIWASQVVLAVNPPANAGEMRDIGSSPGSGRSPGGGHGNPLQYSCLENLMDRGAWQATVHSIIKSQTRLKWFSTHVHVTAYFYSWLFTSCLFYQQNASFQHVINFNVATWTWIQLYICFHAFGILVYHCPYDVNYDALEAVIFHQVRKESICLLYYYSWNEIILQPDHSRNKKYNFATWWIFITFILLDVWGFFFKPTM